jgi:gas vesicle protein
MHLQGGYGEIQSLLNLRREPMRRKSHKNLKKAGAAKVVTGLLVGSILGATVGWLTSPVSGEELRRRFRMGSVSARERMKTAEGNIESQARELAAQVSPSIETASETGTAPRKRITTGGS